MRTQTRLLLAFTLLLAACASKEKATADDHPADDKDAVPSAPPADVQAPEAKSDDLGYGEDVKLFDSPAGAIQEILSVKPQIIGFGEFHKLTSSAKVQSALRRFADDVMDVVGPKTAHLVLETWSVNPKCGAKGKAVTKKVEETIQRPKEVENEMQILMRKTKEHGIRGHVLEFTCKEYADLLNKKESDPGGKDALNAEKLLETVSRKLGESALRAWEEKKSDKMVLVYGGATHNNLSPYAGLEAWSYPQELVKKSKANFVEVDLYVPELVAGDKLLSQEAWYPLLKEARKDQVILIRRDPTSYIIVMRKEYAELGEGEKDGENGDKENDHSGQDKGAANP